MTITYTWLGRIVSFFLHILAEQSHQDGIYFILATQQLQLGRVGRGFVICWHKISALSQ